jgi:hypothetical protein
MKRVRCVAAIALGSVVACGPSIRVFHDQRVPVLTGSAWTWGASDAGRSFPERHPMVDNATVRARVERALAAELERKGFSRAADSSQARFLVHFHIGIEERHEVVGELRPPCVGDACLMDWGYWGRPESMSREIAYEAGQLMVDFVDSGSRKVIWRGVLENDFVKQDVEEAQLAKYLRKLLGSLPAR